MTDPPSGVPASRDVVSTRLFAAPRELVFGAFSDPTVLADWWGPQGFASTFQEFDLRPGGAWRFVMHGPDGTDYPMEKRFLVVVPGEQIVLRHEDPTHGFQMTMTFTEEAGQTRLTWRMRFDTAEEAERVRGFVANANEQNLDRLAERLAATP